MTRLSRRELTLKALIHTRRSLVHTRSPLVHRSRSRHGSFSLIDSLTLALADDNQTEMYAGAALEVIPLSISLLHYPHGFGRWRLRQDSVVSEDNPLLPLILGTLQDHDDHDNFRFFSKDQIENAVGGSTLEDLEVPVDFNTDWDYSVDKYDTDVDRERLSGDDGLSGYGSLESFERRRRRSLPTSSKLGSDVEEDETEAEAEFQQHYPAKLVYQRFYLAEEDLVLGIAGYTSCWWKQVIYYLLCMCTLGMAYLILRWFPRYRINLLGNPLALGVADWCVIENEFGELQIVDVDQQKYGERLLSFISDNEALNPNDEVEMEEIGAKRDPNPVVPIVHSFTYRYIKFFYSPVEDIFRTNSNWYDPKWLSVSGCRDGVLQLLHDQRLEVFGLNQIAIETKLTRQLLVDEVLHPFYVFQVFLVLLWLADNYYYYALCIFVILGALIINSLIETKRTLARLQEMSRFCCEVRVWRNEFWKQVPSTELVPGDVFEVDPSLSVVPCDALLINGECVVNEAMLTGELVPVTKSQATQDTVELLPENFKTPLLSKLYLYNGTRLLKMKTTNDEPVVAMCVATGFNTTKGLLVRLMLFPKPLGFKFYQDSFKYIGFMAIIALIGFSYSTYNFIKLGLSRKLMLLRALDIITIVVPPALPATLTIGTTFAVLRLKQRGIFCIAPTRVNVAGKLELVAFDKTGTLTEDGLDVLGVHISNNALGRKEIVFGDMLKSGQDIVDDINYRHLESHATNHGIYVMAAMALCHSLRMIDDEIVGDPLDVKMFDYTNWEFTEDLRGHIVVKKGENSFTVLREFEFVSQLRRMLVIIKGNHDQELALVKGAPEVIVEICNSELIPTQFEELLHRYTHTGFRVIALAYKDVSKSQFLQREEVESDLTFAGFIVFENKLKPQTKPTLRKLNEAAIRTVMCTGDNVLTAILVGRELSLIDPDASVFIPEWEENEQGGRLGWVNVDNPESKLDPVTFKPVETDIRHTLVKLAITGDVFRYILTELNNVNVTQYVLMNCDIFARMLPDEKHELVEQLQKLDYTVGFCGDGANDCGALKAADVGISLSEAEASVAAPFTSRQFDISCVIEVIREGRLSLVTLFLCFKYMLLYLAIQFITVSILYKLGTNLGDFQFLYIDLFLILPLAIFMLWCKPYHKLVTKRPTANLVSPKILIPLLCQIFVLALFQIGLWLQVKKEPWYVEPVPGGDDEVKLSDNTVLFLFSNFQYILMSVVLSVGPPYREPISKNTPYLINLVVSTLISIALFAVDGNSKTGDLMQLTNLSRGFYWLLLVMAAVNFGLMLFGEAKLFGKVADAYKHVFRRLSRGQSKKLFKNLRKEEFSMVVV